MAQARLLAALGGLIVLLGTAGPAGSATTSPTLVATPPQPSWRELTVEQKIVLAPLSDDWDSFEYFRQKKWLSIASRFMSMTADEQRRILGQMQEWGKLTPEQRRQARENFKSASHLSASEKEELKKKWEEYSSLPDEEKAKLQREAQAVSKPAPKPGRPTAAAPPIAPAAPAAATADAATLPPPLPTAEKTAEVSAPAKP